jgi:glycosyltransferase involved in cell wall biosynthesis
MKVVINAIPVSPSGGLTALLGLLEGWRQIGADMDITVPIWRPGAIEALRNKGWGRILHPVALRGAAHSQWWQRKCLPRLLKELKPDLLLTNNFYIDHVPCLQVVYHQTLWSLFSTRLWSYIRRGPRRLMLTLGARKALRHAAANIFISNYMREAAEAIVPESRPRNHVAHYGLNQVYMRLAQDEASLGEPSTRLCAIQSPAKHKDNDTLLQSLAELLHLDGSRDWRLDIIGGGDWRKYERKARRIGIAEKVRFLGVMNLDQIAQEYRQSLCLVYPSVFEGFGIPLIEAMACGCPAVAVETTAIPEIAGGAALLVPPRRPKEIAKAVLTLYNQPSVRRKFILEGKARALQFPVSKTAQTFLEVFQNVVGAKQVAAS